MIKKKKMKRMHRCIDYMHLETFHVNFKPTDFYVICTTIDTFIFSLQVESELNY